jgi:hypothetical protein
MLSTKIRATTIALVAASSFAGASLVPTVAQADGYNGYQELARTEAWVPSCECQEKLPETEASAIEKYSQALATGLYLP